MSNPLDVPLTKGERLLFQDSVAEGIAFAKFPISAFVPLGLEVLEGQPGNLYHALTMMYCTLHLIGHKGSVAADNRKEMIKGYILKTAAAREEIPQSVYVAAGGALATATDATFIRIIAYFPKISFLNSLYVVDPVMAKDFIFFFLRNIPFSFSVDAAEQLRERCRLNVEDFIVLKMGKFKKQIIVEQLASGEFGGREKLELGELVGSEEPEVPLIFTGRRETPLVPDFDRFPGKFSSGSRLRGG